MVARFARGWVHWNGRSTPHRLVAVARPEVARGDGGDEQRRRPEIGDVEDVAKEQREGSEWHIRILRLWRARLQAQPSSTTPVSRNLWYELFSVIYVVHKLLLIHSFTAVIFLKQELPSSIVPIQMPDHGRVRLALGHNMMFMSTYSIPLGGEKILIHGWSQIMKARPSWRIGQKIMFMLFHGSKANILFIDHVAR